MFGYLRVCQDELKIKDFKSYRAWYCGLCEALRTRHGQLSRFSLTYDMTFLLLLLQGLYEEKEVCEEKRCLPHPLKKHPVRQSEITAYAADMNVLLAYYDLLDDWQDEKKLSGLILSKGMERTFKKTGEAYERQSAAIERYLKALQACEREKNKNLDLAAGLTGELMGEIFVYREDAFAPALRRLGFYLGKFIYLMDAYEDIGSDIEKGSYNPFVTWYREADFDSRAKGLLTMIAADAAKSFEKLPIEENLDILRNILYCGMWSPTGTKKKRSKKEKLQ